VARDHKAEFAAWLSEHEIALTHAARAICFDIQNAPDILQEALADVFQRWNKIKDHDNLEAYTIRVMISKHADLRRKYARKKSENEISLELVAAVLQLADSTENIAERLLVRAGIAALSPAQRAVLLMHYEYGYSLKEIATLLNIPPGTAASHLARGRSAVSEYIQFSPEVSYMASLERREALEQRPFSDDQSNSTDKESSKDE
jgi:RNA polymerase sigma factor (sigma-70 family)